MRHELKTRQEFFRVSWAGAKPFEIRINDRNFRAHDEVILVEVEDANPEEQTGRRIWGFIDYVTDFEQKDGMVVFSYRETGREE